MDKIHPETKHLRYREINLRYSREVLKEKLSANSITPANLTEAVLQWTLSFKYFPKISPYNAKTWPRGSGQDLFRFACSPVKMFERYILPNFKGFKCMNKRMWFCTILAWGLKLCKIERIHHTPIGNRMDNDLTSVLKNYHHPLQVNSSMIRQEL